ncbi:MAG TPA: DUF6152 family protein [Gammaproteobacteria bacterium]
MKRAVVLCLGVGLLATAAAAHHSFAVYDLETNVELVGIVGTLKFRNPHIAMTLIGSEENGEEEIVYSLEGAPANMLVRIGLTPAQVQPGERIRVIASPRKDDQNVFLLKAIILKDGTRFQILN